MTLAAQDGRQVPTLGAAQGAHASLALADLGAMAQTGPRGSTPWTEGAPVRSGPRIVEALRLHGAAAAAAETASADAIDGYAARVPMAGILQRYPVLAIRAGAGPLSRRDRGPAPAIFEVDRLPEGDRAMARPCAVQRLA
ncbi:hypothetical protein [Rubrimonas cliftonensis]|uniref:Uncharacterized protein n=1 Tax=Rubrimonas cliftonensis TaxID=89524 RepID=A0A1H4CFB8_9RHOB|nr:hypothetical protein [Rubrimonas cliftonensis]SEA59125.1 hypothetical protein SAMN05444370_10750 [Rubrimonas cliftonensis]